MFTNKLDAKKRRHLRIRKKINGTLDRPRLVVYKSLSHIHAQIVNDEKRTVLVSASELSSTKLELDSNLLNFFSASLKSK